MATCSACQQGYHAGATLELLQAQACPDRARLAYLRETRDHHLRPGGHHRPGCPLEITNPCSEIPLEATALCDFGGTQTGRVLATIPNYWEPFSNLPRTPVIDRTKKPWMEPF